MTATAAAAIEASGLTKTFGRVTALDGLTMTVPSGEIFGFLGPNGAGKTTAIKLLLGLSQPTTGTARVLDAPAGDRATRRRIGYLPELFRYQGWLSAYEVLQLHARLSRMARERRAREIETALVLVGLADRAHDRVGTFSKGMQQRLGLAAALVGEPELVFLDEPTSALDPVGRHDVREVIRGLAARGTAVFLNSHLLSEVEQVCDRVAVVDHGRVVASGDLKNLLQGSGVRIRVTGFDDGTAALRGFGTVDHSGEWISIAGITPEAIPEVVRLLVGAGAQVHAVEPRHESLEDRFLQLLGGE